jgi:hypothetical protein
MSDTGEIAEGLASALLGKLGVPNAIGALILDQIFPSGGLPSYFAEVYAEITKIVNQAVTADTIAVVDGKVNGTQQFVRDVYTPLKKDPAKTPQDRFNAINPFDNDLYENVVATLRDERYAQPGFSVFLIGAGVHLSVLQELAFTDPEHQDNPANSPYAKATSSAAQTYADFAAATWLKVAQARRDAITLAHLFHWAEMA